MNKLVLIIISIFCFSACKKNKNGCSYACSCINTNNEIFFGATADSDSVYNRILGTWYMKQDEAWGPGDYCNRNCNCNNQYPFIVLPNKTIIRSLASSFKDTVGYTFPPYNDTLVVTNGVYYTLHDSVVLGFIYYNGDFLYLSTLSQYYNSNLYTNTEYDYFLTRN